jgi:thiol-disulfide isomerase/thioredoxin
MKTLPKKWMALLLALAAITASPLSAETTLKIGDPAPKLQNGQYVQGDPVKEFQPGKAYIVEFWATWCGPCKASIPHLNDIYNKYKDKGLVVIGQDCWEKDDTLVAPFIKKMGGAMAYRVALDDKSGGSKGKMAETWMAAAGRNGIPSAFLIDTKGSVAWIGHPMDLEKKEEIIDQVLAGNYDLKKALVDYNEDLKAKAEQKAANEKKMAPIMEKMKAFNTAIRDKKWDEATDALAAFEKVIPEDEQAGMQITFGMDHFKILVGRKDYAAADELAAKLSDAHKEKPLLLNYMIKQIVADKAVEKPDLDFAQKLVNRANERAGGTNAEILATQARIFFMKGEKEEAVKTQTEAVAMADAKGRESLQSKLDSYKKGELPPVY